MPLKLRLTDLDYGLAARELGVEPEALIAVATVESKGAGFDRDGFPIILFERHKFYKNANRSKRNDWYRSQPAICNPKGTPRGGYGSMADQRRKFSIAFRLDPDAAMMACSWGAFQELGENYDDYGFDTVGEFVDQMKAGIDGQLDIFIRSIRKRGLVDELQRHDWRGFARNYNGPEFERWEYHIKIPAAYRAAKARKTDWDALLAQADVGAITDAEIDELTGSLGPTDSTEAEEAAASNTIPPQWPASIPVEPSAGEEISGVVPGDPSLSADSRTPDRETTVSTPAGDAPDAAPKRFLLVEDWKPFVKRWLAKVWALVPGVGIPGGGAAGFAALNDPDRWHIYAAVFGGVFLLVLGFVLLCSIVLLAILFWNRKEIVHYITESWRARMDPKMANFGLEFEKK